MYNTEEELRVARLAFLEDTIAYYSADVSRRAVTKNEDFKDSYCSYRTKDDKRCAIGRHIPDEKYYAGIENRVANNFAVLAVLPSAISNLSGVDCNGINDFLCDVQYLHDKSEYWSTDGLSQIGIDLYNNIKRRYQLNKSNG